MKRIIFVDDEANVLAALQRMLFFMTDEWDMTFAQSGEEALNRMREKPFDVIVSDMRMPQMDGAQLLTEVKRMYPQTVRFVLSGHADDETAFRAVDTAHQFISKPCDPEELQSLINRALSLRQKLNDDSVKKLVGSLDSLPSLPSFYDELLDELQSRDPSLKVVGKIIGKDVAMSAKVLQLVNSAFFGLRNTVTDLTQAASLLGIETIRSLVLMINSVSNIARTRLPAGFSLDAATGHGMSVATRAQKIAKTMTDSRQTIQNAFTAGLLHDVGKLVLASNLRKQYAEVISTHGHDARAFWEVELDILGSTHCEVGAYLLGIWGLPDTIVEAVAYHHSPSLCDVDSDPTLPTIHVADFFDHEEKRLAEGTAVNYASLDNQYFARTELDKRIDEWRKLCGMAAMGKHND